MAFPTVASTTFSLFSGTTTAHDVLMPATVAANDLLITIISWSSSSYTVPTPSGWTLVETVTHDNSGGSADREGSQAIYVKKADGTEDGTTVDFVTSTAITAEGLVYQIDAASWSQTVSDVEVGTAVLSANADYATELPNPPSLTPTGGAKDYLWITMFTNAWGGTDATAPTNYTNVVNGTGSGSNVKISAAERAVNGTVEDPGAFGTVSIAFRINIAQTLVVAPAAATGGEPTLPSRRRKYLLHVRGQARR